MTEHESLVDRLGVRAPRAQQRAALEEDHRTDARAVVQGEALDIEHHPGAGGGRRRAGDRGRCRPPVAGRGAGLAGVDGAGRPGRHEISRPFVHNNDNLRTKDDSPAFEGM